ncbi:MAG: SH3 domain-containing protein [Taibaiella sp.]|jgi:tetratricopeptide (TPR) repeat protein
MQVKKSWGKSLNIRSYIMVLCLICFLVPSCIYATTGDDVIWKKANNFYTQKQYDSAEYYYSALLKKYPENAIIQYNMGNVSFRLNKVGAAVLHYQKAALLDPGNKEIQDNLLLAKGRIQNPLPEAAPIFFVRWWNGLLQLFSADTWAVITFIIFLAVLGLVWYARVKKEQFAHAGRWLSLSVVCFIICACMTWFTHESFTHSDMAVVLEPSANLLEAPRASGKVLGALPEGTVIEVYTEEGNFMNVKLPNGREGWILSSSVEKV